MARFQVSLGRRADHKVLWTVHDFATGQTITKIAEDRWTAREAAYGAMKAILDAEVVENEVVECNEAQDLYEQTKETWPSVPRKKGGS